MENFSRCYFLVQRLIKDVMSWDTTVDFFHSDSYQIILHCKKKNVFVTFWNLCGGLWYYQVVFLLFSFPGLHSLRLWRRWHSLTLNRVWTKCWVTLPLVASWLMITLGNTLQEDLILVLFVLFYVWYVISCLTLAWGIPLLYG